MKPQNKDKESKKPDKSDVFKNASSPVDIIQKTEEVTKRWLTKDIQPPANVKKPEDEKKVYCDFAF